MQKPYISSKVIIIAILVLYGCNTTPNNLIKNADWLLGTWENKRKKGSIYENWIKVSETEFLAKSYKIQENDTIVLETIQLIQEEDKLFFIPKVKNQNNNQPIRFTSTLVSEDKMVFENPAHDFPQAITYTKINTDSLLAVTSGNDNNEERKIQFAMRKVKD